MSLNVKGYIQAIDLSGKHMRFTDTHRTYSPNPTVYNAGSSYADFELIVLHQLLFSELDNSVIDSALVDQLYTIIQWLIDESIDGELTTDTPASNAAIGIVFNDVNTTVTLGTCSDDTNSRTLPEWVEIQTGDHVFKFWLLSTALENQYNIRQFKVAEPLADKDDFYVSTKVGLTALLANYVNNPYNALNTVLASSPTTKVIPHTEQWIELNNTNNTIDIQFLIAVYGPGTPTSEELRAGLRDYLLEGSAHESGTWESVFPGIFRVSAFAIIPAYYDIVNGSIPQYYNPIITVSDYFAKLEDNAFNYDPNWVSDNVQVIPTIYQSINCLVIPDDTNDLSKRDFKAFFPQYILAGALDPDYVRLDTNARKLVDFLTNVLPLAEGTSSVIPVGVTEELINGLRWYQFTVGEAQIRILTKASLDNITV